MSEESSQNALEISVASQRRRQILRAAMACISQLGTEKTTMRAVARRAGLSTGTLAYYFNDKKQLLDAALIDASREYMEHFNRTKEKSYGPQFLDDLVEGFLGSDDPDARFVLQMIEAGLHNRELRSAHDEMIEAGRDMIEKSVRIGMATGDYRQDIDPSLYAAMLHSMLIWWRSELSGDATSRELAVHVGRFALDLLKPPAVRDASPAVMDGEADATVSTVERVRSHLFADPQLSDATARTLEETFEKLYQLATASSGRSTD